MDGSITDIHVCRYESTANRGAPHRGYCYMRKGEDGIWRNLAATPTLSQTALRLASDLREIDGYRQVPIHYSPAYPMEYVTATQVSLRYFPLTREEADEFWDAFTTAQ